MIKNPPANTGALGREDPLEKGMATHSSILAWEIPWTEEPGRLQSMGLQRVGHDLATKQQQIYTWILKLLLIKYSTKYFSLLHPTLHITNTSEKQSYSFSVLCTHIFSRWRNFSFLFGKVMSTTQCNISFKIQGLESCTPDWSIITSYFMFSSVFYLGLPLVSDFLMLISTNHSFV